MEDHIPRHGIFGQFQVHGGERSQTPVCNKYLDGVAIDTILERLFVD